MNCRELVEFLIDYVSGELPTERRALFEGHLAECPNCVAYVQSYRATIEAGKAAYDDPEARVAAMPPKLVQAILASRQ